jgi:hypothetical protein
MPTGVLLKTRKQKEQARQVAISELREPSLFLRNDHIQAVKGNIEALMKRAKTISRPASGIFFQKQYHVCGVWNYTRRGLYSLIVFMKLL